MPFANHDNPANYHFRSSTSTFHDIFGNFSNNPLYPSSNPGISLQQGFPMFLNSEQNMVMGSRGAVYQSSFSEPVLGTCFQLMQDLGQPLDSFMSNLPNQQPHFMDDQPQPDPCENSGSIVCSPSNKNNLFDQNGNLNHNIDPIMVPNGPLWSPVFNSYWLQSGNEHGSNQQQQPNSHSSSDQSIQQQLSDSAMTWNPSQQNSAEIILINLQPFDQHPAIFDERDSMEIEALSLAPVGNRDMHEIENYSAAWIG